jgi:energy-coupling factor transporter ATP-binding protein EcfA2
MQIRKIEIQNYKKLIGPVLIDKIGDGITVIAGDNEEGKSTLLQALRAALFDRHNLTGDAADAMQPFGHRVRPEIGLEFEIGGITYRLKKGYCQKPHAELVMPNGVVLTGPDAEEKLQELLRFRPPGKGQGKPEQHHGVFGMFWIEQGRAFSPLPLSPDNRTTLMGALESEVGQVLGGARGRTLKDNIAARYRVVFTDGGKPRGAYAEAISLAEKLEAEIGPKREQLKQYEDKVDELARTRDRLSGYEKEGRLARAEDGLKTAQAKLDHIGNLENNVAAAEQAFRLAEADVRSPTTAVTQRDALIERENKDRDEAGSFNVPLKRTEEAVTRLSEDFTVRADALKAAESMLDEANKRLLAIDQTIERRRLTAERDRLAAALDAAKTADGNAREARAASSAIKVDAADLKRLRTFDQKRIEAEGALAGCSTLIQFQLKADNPVMVGGTAAPSSGDVSITDPTKLEIVGTGTITIIPGGEELSTKRRNAETAREAFHSALQKLGCASLAEVERSVQERQAYDADADKYAEVLKIHAPEGVDKLSEQLSDAIALIAKLPEAEDDSGLDRATALAAQREADQRVKSARTQRDTCQAKLGEAQQELAKQRALSSSAAQKAAGTAAELERARQEKADNVLRGELATATNQLTQAKAVLEQAQRLLAEADPEVARLSFESARDGHKAIRDEIDRLCTTTERLALELQLLGQQGLGEAIQELEGQLALAIARRDSAKKDADALKLLYHTLVRAEQHAREAFLAPVQKRVQPYLRLLLPESELVLSEDDLGVTALRRNGQDEPFESLSVGAREQVAVLTRLAFADLLRERGVVAPVVLDDALVNSDPRRFERMLLAIRRAAKNLQIIVLTCDEADWVQAGAPMIRLQDCIGMRAN